MSSSVSNYSKLPEFRSPLLNTPQDTLPQSEDLIHLQKELAEYKGKALERIKKAADDARLIEDAFRRMKEKEKGKAKAIQKAERERGCASIPLLSHFLRSLDSSTNSRHHYLRTEPPRFLYV